MAIDLGLDKIKTLEFWRAIFAEFVAVLLFVLNVTSIVLSWSGKDGVDAAANNLKLSMGIGLAIAVLVAMFAHVSGGHLNPAVSIGMIVAGKISIIQGLLYIVAQSIGGNCL